MVVGDGFGNAGSDGIGGFADYKGYLYVGVGTYEGGGGQIWRSRDGLQWEPVVMDGFGNPLDDKIDGLIVYHGMLYAYTTNWTEGGPVSRTTDAVTWERVNTPGWGNPTYSTTHLTSDQVVFKDELYMGVVGPQGVLLKQWRSQRAYNCPEAFIPILAAGIFIAQCAAQKHGHKPCWNDYLRLESLESDYMHRTTQSRIEMSLVPSSFE